MAFSFASVVAVALVLGRGFVLAHFEESEADVHSLAQTGHSLSKATVMDTGLQGVKDPFADLADAFDEIVPESPSSTIDASLPEGAATGVTFVLGLLVFAFLGQVSKGAAEPLPNQADVSCNKDAPVDKSTLQESKKCDWGPGTDAFGCTALHSAAAWGCVEETRQLLAQGADVNAREAWDERPLHFAARSGSVEVCELLLSHGAEINAGNTDDHTPLLVAASAKQEDTCNLLLDHGAHTGGVKDGDLPPLLTSLLAGRAMRAAMMGSGPSSTEDQSVKSISGSEEE